MARIYISSTFEDLKSHRDAVCRQLRRMDHDVIAMEDYVAQDQRPLDSCLKDVARCDVYVGIFGWRYGFIPKAGNPKRLSITELEYRYAERKKKERLVFLVGDTIRWPHTRRDLRTGHGKRGKLIGKLREELKHNMQVGFFKNAADLASKVSAAVTKWGNKVESERRNREAKRVIAKLPDAKKIVINKPFGELRLTVLNDDIRNANTNIVVSSDDSMFTARGGVSKLLARKLGPDVRRELEHYTKAPFRQGEVVITTGGEWGRRAIIHAVVIDLEDQQFPTKVTIRTLTRRSLECAVALGAQSIAFPVLGGGYAETETSSADSVKAMCEEMLAFVKDEGRDKHLLRGIKLYIFNRKDNAGLPAELRPRK